MPSGSIHTNAERLVLRLRRAGLLVALAVCPAYARHAQTNKAPDSMEARLVARAACHGPEGRGTNNDYFPVLQASRRVA